MSKFLTFMLLSHILSIFEVDCTFCWGVAVNRYKD